MLVRRGSTLEEMINQAPVAQDLRGITETPQFRQWTGRIRLVRICRAFI